MRLPHEELPNLSESEAIELLQIHAASCENDADERMQAGFIFSLRHWNGEVNPENFRQVMACIKSLGPSWSSGSISSRTMSDLWSILYIGRDYLHDPRRIQHRKLLGYAVDEVEVGDKWLHCIGWAVMAFLEFNDARAAFSCYDSFIADETIR